MHTCTHMHSFTLQPSFHTTSTIFHPLPSLLMCVQTIYSRQTWWDPNWMWLHVVQGTTVRIAQLISADLACLPSLCHSSLPLYLSPPFFLLDHFSLSYPPSVSHLLLIFLASFLFLFLPHIYSHSFLFLPHTSIPIPPSYIYSHFFSHSFLVYIPIPSCHSYSHSFLTYLFPFFPIPLPLPFQDGIEPMWEDERNKMGGRWLLNIEKRKGDDRKEIMNNCWMETVRAQKCAISLCYCWLIVIVMLLFSRCYLVCGHCYLVIVL